MLRPPRSNGQPDKNLAEINARLTSAVKRCGCLPCTVYWNRREVQICKIAT